MRNGTPIQNAELKNPGSFPSSGITYEMKFESWDACVQSGLDLWMWYKYEYPVEFMTQVVAFHRLKSFQRMHQQDTTIVKPKTGKKVK